jgi:protein ImuB
VFAVLYIPDFALQAVLRTHADGQARAAALFTDKAKKSVLLAANAAARASGIELGMTAPQAVARCPALVIRTPNAAAEADARSALLAVGFTVSPRIEDTAPGVSTLDLKGTDPRRHARIAAAAVAQLQQLGFIASAGIAATPLLALYAARRAAVGVVGEPVLTVTDPASFLASLPLAAADPPGTLVDILTHWGLRTFGDLTALARDDVGRRLGPEGLALWDRAQGGTPRPLHPVVPVQTFSAAMDFEDEIETLEPLLFLLRRFLERLTLELRTSGFVAAALDFALPLSDGTRHEHAFRLPQPTADIEILFRAVHTHLESLRTATSIIGLELRASPTRPLVRQQGLFETGLRDPHGFAETLARVAAIVGADRVGTPQPEDSHRPDAVRLVPSPAVIPPPAEPPVHAIHGLPLRRFRPPLPAQLELTQGKPTYLWTERFAGAVAEMQGPWLSSGEWWQADRAWRRTEYDVAIEGGGLYRLVLTDRRWFIEGEYD